MNEDLPMVLTGGTPPLAVHAADGQPPAVEPGTLAGPLVTLEQAMSETSTAFGPVRSAVRPGERPAVKVV